MTTEILTAISTTYEFAKETDCHVLFGTTNLAGTDFYVMDKVDWQRMNAPKYVQVAVTPVNVNGQPLYNTHKRPPENIIYVKEVNPIER